MVDTSNIVRPLEVLAPLSNAICERCEAVDQRISRVECSAPRVLEKKDATAFAATVYGLAGAEIGNFEVHFDNEALHYEAEYVEWHKRKLLTEAAEKTVQVIQILA